MNYKIIAIDLDGTLLSTKGDITDENLAAIKDLAERGIIFVPVTGRAMYEMPRRVYECEYIRYIISSNGAVIYDKQTGETVSHNFTAEQFARIYSVLKEYEATMTIHYALRSVADSAKVSDEVFNYYRVNDYYKNHIRTHNVMRDDFDEFFSEPREAEMLSVFFRYDSELEEARSRLEAMGDIDITSSTVGNIELIRHGALKGNALSKLIDKLGVSLAETIAVGDSRNDISMLEIAGLALATDNATDAVKAKSHRVICHCDKNTAEYIRDNILKN